MVLTGTHITFSKGSSKNNYLSITILQFTKNDKLI